MITISETVAKVPPRNREYWSSYFQIAKGIFLQNQFVYTAIDLWDFFSLLVKRECGDENGLPLLLDYLNEVYPEVFGKLRYVFDLEFRVREQKQLLHQVLTGKKDRIIFYHHVGAFGQLLGTYGPDDYYHITNEEIQEYTQNEQKRFKEVSKIPELSTHTQASLLKHWGIA